MQAVTINTALLWWETIGNHGCKRETVEKAVRKKSTPSFRNEEIAEASSPTKHKHPLSTSYSRQRMRFDGGILYWDKIKKSAISDYNVETEKLSFPPTFWKHPFFLWSDYFLFYFCLFSFPLMVLPFLEMMYHLTRRQTYRNTYLDLTLIEVFLI